MSQAPRHGQKWNRDETIRALDLLCRTGSWPATADTMRLANALGRSLGSVTRKLANLVSAQTKGKAGLPHRSRIDDEVVAEFSGHPEALAGEMRRLRLERPRAHRPGPRDAD